MGCFYCDEHHEGREAIMFKVGEMKAGVLYLFKDQAHKGRCALALKDHKKELCECEPQELADFAQDLARASVPSRSCGAAPRSTWALSVTPTPTSTSTSSPSMRGASSSAALLPSPTRSRCCSPMRNIRR